MKTVLQPSACETPYYCQTSLKSEVEHLCEAQSLCSLRPQIKVQAGVVSILAPLLHIIGKLQMPTALPGCYIPRYMATIELLLNDTQSHVRHDIWLWLNYCFCWWIPAAHSLTGLSPSSRNPFWRGDWLYLLHLLRYLPIPELQKARAARGNHSNSRWLDKTKSEVRSWRDLYLLKQLLFGSSILHLQICDNRI